MDEWMDGFNASFSASIENQKINDVSMESLNGWIA